MNRAFEYLWRRPGARTVDEIAIDALMTALKTGFSAEGVPTQKRAADPACGILKFLDEAAAAGWTLEECREVLGQLKFSF